MHFLKTNPINAMKPGDILYILRSTVALEAKNFVAMALVLVVRERLSLYRFLHVDAPLDHVHMVPNLLTVKWTQHRV